jgi:hypothetical protein
MGTPKLQAIEGRVVAPNVTVALVPLEDAAREMHDHNNLAAVLFFKIYDEGRFAS